ncbi:MAG: hypothetical protein JNK90_11620 [Planctomycetaceae bacterium]|nr:hypothetical protein [Planctomycetaceae bacterium]
MGGFGIGWAEILILVVLFGLFIGVPVAVVFAVVVLGRNQRTTPTEIQQLQEENARLRDELENSRRS